MNFQDILLGEVFGQPIIHGILHLSFDDYNNFFMKTRGEKPERVDVYTSSDEPGRDYMLGFDFHWKNRPVERKSFKEFWNDFDRNWDWGDRSELLDKYSDHPYSVLDLKYSEVVFQTHQCGACAFDRLHDRVTGFTKDLEAMKKHVSDFDKQCREIRRSGTY